MSNRPRKIHDKLIDTFVAQLKDSKFFQQQFVSTLNKCLEHFGQRKINQVICYGLGSFHNGYEVATRYQLALLLLVYNHLIELGHPLKDSIEVFDPSFESLDKETLWCFNNPTFKILDENEYCARNLDSFTLIYMPHLDKYLYNNLLGANWHTESLSKLILLGNSFQEMIDGEIQAKRRSELYYMNLLVHNFKEQVKTPAREKSKALQRPKIQSKDTTNRALIELPIDDSIFDHLDVFNNLAFHVINEMWLKENGRKMQQSRLNDWQPKIQSFEDDDWPE